MRNFLASHKRSFTPLLAMLTVSLLAGCDLSAQGTGSSWLDGNDSNRAILDNMEVILTDETLMAIQEVDADVKPTLTQKITDNPFFQEQVIEEANTHPGENIVSFRVAENGDIILAVSNGDFMCAARTSEGGVFGDCLNKEEHPDLFSDPLGTIMNDPEVWTAGKVNLEELGGTNVDIS